MPPIASSSIAQLMQQKVQDSTVFSDNMDQQGSSTEVFKERKRSLLKNGNGEEKGAKKVKKSVTFNREVWVQEIARDEEWSGDEHQLDTIKEEEEKEDVVVDEKEEAEEPDKVVKKKKRMPLAKLILKKARLRNKYRMSIMRTLMKYHKVIIR